MPVFTQEAPNYDVLVVADESEVFANNLPYRTWDPRPVAGSAGLVPTSWDASNDLWGGIQMQSRFTEQFKRLMTSLDMQAWTAVRMVGEAASRQNSADPKVLFDFLKGPQLALGAFKGQKLTVRDWDLQLRQPILLTDGRTGSSPDASARSGIRGRTTRNMTFSSRRASEAPRQKCGPNPNARWGLGWRSS